MSDPMKALPFRSPDGSLKGAGAGKPTLAVDDPTEARRVRTPMHRHIRQRVHASPSRSWTPSLSQRGASISGRCNSARMPNWTKKNFEELRDAPPPDVPIQWRFARDALRSPELGVSRLPTNRGRGCPGVTGVASRKRSTSNSRIRSSQARDGRCPASLQAAVRHGTAGIERRNRVGVGLGRFEQPEAG